LTNRMLIPTEFVWREELSPMQLAASLSVDA
jgi:hypothetical protein